MGKYLELFDEYKRFGKERNPSVKEFQDKFQSILADHVAEQTEKVDKHISNMSKMLNNQNRRLMTYDDDDLEDDRGSRFDKNRDKLTAALHTFEGVEG